ncbi:RNA polymerase subunit AC19 [Conglomerata obtusa]
MTQQPKVTISSPYVIKITGEDHTIMNPLRYIIQRNDKSAELVGYSIPHPAENCVEFNIQYKNEGNIAKSMCQGLSDLETLSERMLYLIDNEIALLEK